VEFDFVFWLKRYDSSHNQLFFEKVDEQSHSTMARPKKKVKRNQSNAAVALHVKRLKKY
jgi:hypothetical protein